MEMLKHSKNIWILLSVLLVVIAVCQSVELERRTCFKDNFPLIASDNSETCMGYVHKALYSNRNNSFIMKMSSMNVGPIIGSMQPNFKFNLGDLIQCEVTDNTLPSFGDTDHASTITKTVVSSSSSSASSGKLEHGSGKTDMKIYTTNAAVPNYVYVPASPTGCFSFKVRAKNMVHISLNSAPYIQSPMYEIVLAQKGSFGYAAGTSVIRKNNNIGTNVAQVRTNPNILNENEFMGFWIKWSATGLIEVGYEGEEMPFLYYKDTTMCAVNYIGIMTHSCSGAWHIQEPKCPGINNFATQTSTNEINGNINVLQPGVLESLKSKFNFIGSSPQPGGTAPLAPLSSIPLSPISSTTTTTFTSSTPGQLSSNSNLKVKCWRIPSAYSQKNFTVVSTGVQMEKEFEKLMKLQDKLFQKIEQKYKKYENLPVPLQKNKRYLKDLMLDLNDDYQKAKELNDKLFFSTIEFEKEPAAVQKYFKDDRFNTINTMYFDLNNKVQTKIKQVITQPDAEWHQVPENIIIPDKSGKMILNVNGTMPQYSSGTGQNMTFTNTRTVIHFTPSTVVNLQTHVLDDLQNEYDKYKKSDQHSKAYLKLLQQKLDEYLIKAKDRDREIKIMHSDYEGDKNFNNYYKNDVYKKITTIYNQFNIQLKKEFEKNSNSNIQNLIDGEANYTKQIEELYGDFKMEGKDWTKEELESALKKCEGLFAEMTKIHSKLLRTEVTDDKEELIMKAYLERNRFFNAKVMFFAFYGGLQGAIEEKSGPIRIFKTIITPDDFEYKYFNAPETQNLTFKILAQNDAHILLTKGLGKSDAMFEIFLGEEYNTASSIRKNALKYVTQLKTPNLLSAVEPKEFWVTWVNGQINVGHAGETKAFMSYTEKKMFPINFIGIRTIDGSSGTWYFEDALVTITEYEINVKKTTIFQGKTTVVRG